MGGLQNRVLTWASAAALLSSGAVAAGASGLAVSVTAPGVGTVDARLPAVQTPSVTVPAITVPSVPLPPAPVPSAPAVQTPSVQTPTVQTPTVQSPSVQAPSAPATPRVGGIEQSGSGGTGATGTTPARPEPVGAGGDAAATGAGGDESSRASATSGSDMGAGQSASGPADALRARRYRIAAGGSLDHPAGRVGSAQRRLELAVEHARQCLDDLHRGERRVLDLRAGIGPGVPLTRPQTARRLDLGVAQTGRIERRGLRRLDALASAGACGGAGGAVASAGPLAATGALAGGATLVADASDSRSRFDVGGVVAHGGGDPASDGRSGLDALPPPIGDGGEATLLVALGLLVTLALLVRRELSRR
jgi:hypothetical protein